MRVRMGTGWLGIALLVASAASGCAHYAASLTPTARPAADHAYVYGRFQMDAESHALAMGGYATMGFKLACDNGETYTIRFWKNPHVQVIDVVPGKCAMAEIVFSHADGSIAGRKLPPPGWRTPRLFAAGTANYLGDYAGANTQEWKVVMTEFQWQLTSEENDYADSTKDLFATYPAFTGIATADRSFVSAPPKARARRRPADFRSPSPKQVARAAALIDRTSPSLRACETTCTTGDCMAFRTEDGETAMTCLVYCKGDGDCPDGFTCAGPPAGGSPAAQSDEDEAPLANICVRRRSEAASSSDR